MESYLVQVWVPADEAAADADLRGVIRHVGSGVETPFHGEAEGSSPREWCMTTTAATSIANNNGSGCRDQASYRRDRMTAGSL
jgi:hypothetical protein